MKADLAQPIGPLALSDVRALFRKLNRNVMTFAMLSDALKLIGRPLPRKALRALIDALIEVGYLAIDGEHDGKTVFKTTDLAFRLAASKNLKRFDRKTGNELVAGLLARVTALNGDLHNPVCVARVRAFGSYISAVDDLGDIDLVLDLVTRDGADLSAEMDYGEHFGPPRRGLLALASSSRDLALKQLRARYARLSFHTAEELDALACPFKTIFQAACADVPRYARHPDLAPSRHEAHAFNPAALEKTRLAAFTPMADRNA